MTHQEIQPMSNCIFEGCSCLFEEDLNEIECLNLASFPKRYDIIEQKDIKFEKIDITGTIKQIPDDRFDETSFEEVQLVNNQIRIIGKNAFKGLKKIKVLDLSKNCLGCSEGQENPNIESDNSIEAGEVHDSIEPELFDPINSTLTTLRLNQNRLNRLSLKSLNRLFQNVGQLKYLEINSNSLSHSPNLRHLKKLETLILSLNKIQSLSSHTDLIIPPSLKTLDLHRNSIQTIEANWFSELKDLTRLILSRNQITSIAENAFVNLKNLEHLDLSYNEFNHIPSRVFYHLGSLKLLDLSGQRQLMLRSIGDFAFDRESASKNHKLVINLANNGISKISNRAFCARNSAEQHVIINTERLNLNNNPLSTVNGCILKQLHKHTELILPTVNCTCDITYLNQYLKLDGTCKQEDSQLLVKLDQFNCLNQNLNCQSDEFNCVDLSKPAESTKSFEQQKTQKDNSNISEDSKQVTTLNPGEVRGGSAKIIIKKIFPFFSSFISIILLAK